MPELRHDLEGTPDATAVTTGSGGNSNTAGNNYFNLAPRDATGTPGTNEYASDLVFAGTRALKIRSGSVAAATYVGWNATSRGSVQDDFGSITFRWDALPSLTVALVAWYSAALASMGRVLQANSGALGIQSAGASTLTLNNGTTSSTAILAADTWYRLEFWHHAETTANGRITCRLYSSTGLILDEFTSQAVDATMPAAATQRTDFGICSNNASQPVSTSDFLRIDDILDTATAWPTAAPSLNTVLTSTLRS